MNARTTTRALAGAAAILALAGGGVAYAASGDSPSKQGTQTAPDAARTAPAHPGDHGPGGFAFGPRGGGFLLGDAGAAADYLGLSQEELRDRLSDGRSLADVARAEGKSVEGLEEALLADATARLDRAVDDGWLGARARDEMLAGLRERIGELVQMTGPKDIPRPSFRGGPGGDCAPGRGGVPAPPAAPDGSAPEPPRDPGDSDEAPDAGSSTTPGSWRDAPAASVWS
ncbi:hypothetical protein [Conexibacter woesei]|uniref:Uncharacterized protein n=1 Tax=Conexibacter woesei (strain DSM 14684 / CCUG 47730 / CIP 108061 / JCM 11494 / NBRC 100937 / ID131577) TaxID=469383 RepID=D3FBX4_CONWI|nr:hypothetical protein [Conexibacter woesei]ADB51389.1 hypothetical protein Cwoe_2970 [Conexibacter woesei DSM 14684]